MIRPPEPGGPESQNPATSPAKSTALTTRTDAGRPDRPIAEALRLLRTRQGLTQTNASQLEGAPHLRTVCHWETGQKTPSLMLLIAYLTGMGLDLCDLQDALNELQAPHPTGCRAGLEKLE